MNEMQKTLNMPKIALGAWAWGSGAAGGDQVFGHHLTTAELRPVFEKSLAVGLNLWDTAAVYGMGSSGAMLGEFVQDIPREAVLLSTKFTPQIAEAIANPGEKMLAGSFERLHTDVIDIYWIHNPADVAKWTPALIPLAKSGKIKYIGVSNHNLAEIKLANEILAKEGLKVSALQNHFSLLHRSSEEAGILAYAKEQGMTFFSYMVLEQGALSGKYDTAHPFPEGSDRAAAYNESLPQLETLLQLMADIGKKYNATVAQIATAWAIAKGTVPIIGVTKVEQVMDAAQAANIQLTAEEMAALENLAQTAGVKTIRDWEKPMA
ncbi:aldo/keto reductase [Enterococcus sp. HY326]|uniref:aldo/keto reductase n=1 Tax=Enterococcus sp. HY326 TaxID=2971265 RepID=UPI00223F6866|nr:aldo/keto reductase [Enterococcus sp. HY326]